LLCQAVFRPTDEAQLVEFLSWARENRKNFRAVGGRTGTNDPQPCYIAVDTSLLTGLTWSEEDLTVTAGAGLTIAAIEEQLGRHGYTLGQVLGSANLATVGGCIATDAHGLFTGRYGSFRECVWSQKALGGIITEATLRMHPQPEARAWAVFDFERFDDACAALRLIHRCDSRPALARTLAPQRVILAFEGDELVQTGHFQLAYAVCQQLGGVPADPDEGEAWLESRQKNDFWSANAQDGVFADFLRFPAPWSKLAECYAGFQQQLDGRVADYRLEIAHPTPHGATIEISFIVHGDEQRYRELRAAILF
jgi:FAD/FMN-containing dehydrogenase